MIVSDIQQLAQGNSSPLIRSPAKAPEIRNVIGAGAGYFFVGEGIASILFSKDTRTLPQLGRIFRILIGAFFAVHFTIAIHTKAEDKAAQQVQE